MDRQFTPSSHRYAYDALNRRVAAALADGSRWVYDYNDRNELVSGRRSWADHSPVSGQQFLFAFDSIGNLKTNWSGGDINGANLRPSAYTVNSLNQYTAIGVPGYEDVMGVAHASATVTVNSQPTDRKGEYYHRELSLNSSSGPVWTNITVSSTTNLTGNLLVAPATRSLTYDDDGNLTADGLWTYQWDGENRLKQIESAGTVPTAARRKLVLAYDHLGRRSTKKVYIWSGGDYSATPSLDLRFVYDAWNLLAELNATNNTPIRSYVWGQDLSGSLQGAGGIGGLLIVRDHGAGTYHFAGYDGNGNVTVLVNAANQGLSAQYEYSPFGELLRATGPLARANPFRFSTKFIDEETDLVYYGYRYYSPSLMRWVNRDPIGEVDGPNVYAYVANRTVNSFDPLGQAQDKQPGYGLPDDFWRWIHDRIKRDYGRPLTPDEARAEHADWLDQGKPKGPRGRKGLKFGGGGKGRGAMLAGGGILLSVLISEAQAGLASSSGIESYFTYDAQQSLLVNSSDFFHHKMSGDGAMADLDAIMIAIDVSNLTGDTQAAMWVWDAITD